MNNIKNLTPHVLNIYDENKNLIISIEPEEKPARVKVSKTHFDTKFGVPLFVTLFGEIENLPNPEKDVILVTSLLVRQAVLDRDDVFSPGELLRDEKGVPVGCIGLTQ